MLRESGVWVSGFSVIMLAIFDLGSCRITAEKSGCNPDIFVSQEFPGPITPYAGLIAMAESGGLIIRPVGTPIEQALNSALKDGQVRIIGSTNASGILYPQDLQTPMQRVTIELPSCIVTSSRDN